MTRCFVSYRVQITGELKRVLNHYLYKLCTELKLLDRVCAWLKELKKAYRICAQNILFRRIILELMSVVFSFQQHNPFMSQFITSILCVSGSQCFTAGEITDRGADLSRLNFNLYSLQTQELPSLIHQLICTF
jgi:hypothetical protein